jgi:Rieske Fe-S protein
MKTKGKLFGLGVFIYFAIIALLLIGEVRCIYKAITCNWEPVGKAEILYTVSACTGLGCIVGWINIEDK